VFSIFVVARRSTSVEGDADLARDQRELAEGQGDALVRSVRSVVWRRTGDEVSVVPIVRWEVLDYSPYEVLDYPDEER
jgi:hypothetical protein